MADFDCKIMGKKIKELREENGLSQKKLSHLTGLSKECIDRTEAGINNPKASTILALADALHCTPNDLFGIDNDYSFLEGLDPVVLERLKDFLTTYRITQKQKMEK